MSTILAIPSVILPTSAPLGTETETIDDLLEHTSLEVPAEYIHEKTIFITATEVALAPAAIPGNLWIWVEISPYPSANTTYINEAGDSYWESPLPTSTSFWSAIGGGGGAIAPTSPLIEVSGLAGAAGSLVHGINIPWSIHSSWVRIVIQTPVAASLPNAYWVIQARYSGKNP